MKLRQQVIDGELTTYKNRRSYRHKDGHIIWGDVTGSIVRDNNGTPLYFVAHTVDVTDQLKHEEALSNAKEKAETAEELFSKVFRSSPMLFAISSPEDGRHIDVNDAWSSITGYSREEANEKTVIELGLWANAEDRVKFVKQIKNQGFVRNYETVFRTKYGVELNMLLFGEIIDFRGEDRMLVVGQDITERTEIERMKHEFISIASHELRTPLTSLMGALGLINSNLVGEISEEVTPILEIAYRNSERLSKLIDDILSIEKLDAGKMEFTKKLLAIPPLIDQAISEHAGYGIERDISFVLNGEVPDIAVLGDKDRLMQVFSNLMSNAAKFSPKGTVVQLSACERGKDVRISITDEGSGIPEEFHDKVFEKFSRANTSDTGHLGGTGLGLSIAKAVIEQHGGELRFETETDVGTTFFFDLPKTDRLSNS